MKGKKNVREQHDKKKFLGKKKKLAVRLGVGEMITKRVGGNAKTQGCLSIAFGESEFLLNSKDPEDHRGGRRRVT